MKKFGLIVLMLMLVACSTKEIVKIDYMHDKHDEIVAEVLTPLGKNKSDEILYESEENIEVYYDVDTEDKSKVTFTILNLSDYYYTGEIEFDSCEYKISVDGLAPDASVEQSIVCPEFVEDSEFTYTGLLFERKDEYKYDVAYDYYYYEDDEIMFDFVLDLETITQEDIKAFTEYLYIENILSNYESEMAIYVYPKAAYDKDYNENSEEAWNDLDTNHLAGTIWLDTKNDIAEIYDGKTFELVERINFAK